MTTPIDKGTAYERKTATHDATLTEVGRGKPMGELLRRYWHPVGLSADATATPRQIRVLGEDLILFRDGTGRAGLLHAAARTAARRSTTARWRNAASAAATMAGCSMCRVIASSSPANPAAARHGATRSASPGTRCEERYGLVFAYLGPPDRKAGAAALRLPRRRSPRASSSRPTIPPSAVAAADRSSPATGCSTGRTWWIPSTSRSCTAPSPARSSSTQMGVMPKVKFDDHAARRARRVAAPLRRGRRPPPRDRGGDADAARGAQSARRAATASVESIGWVLPIDDTHFRIYVAGRVTREGRAGADSARRWAASSGGSSDRGGAPAFPGDYEAQVGQGPITLHSEEHLTLTDRGIAMLRQLLRRQIEAVAAGANPINTVFSESESLVRLEAGNYLDSAATPA